VKRIAAILAALIAVVAILATGTAAGGDDGTYEVRAIFDNASFLVPGEEVRIAGAKVGSVSDIDVTGTDEAVHEDGSPEPGKAAVVLRIDDPGFQDFREDASCLVRPQSLIGEKFVECEPTQPRAADSPAPPELEQVGEGEPGEGQRLLPLERNGKSVDVDLVNNIMRESYRDRFRLILNSLGAGFAARGEELDEIIERANPALRETNEVLAILARQNRTLAELATNSDRVIGELARQRAAIAGFINSSEVAGRATANQRPALEEGLQKFPGFLRELRATMNRLDAFARATAPVLADFRAAAPSLTSATEALGPFSDATTGALTSLGDAAEAAGPDLISAEPVLRQVRHLGISGEPATKNLARFFATLRKTEGTRFLAELLFNTGGAINVFDQYGHWLRALLPLNNCVDYESIPEPGCSATFATTATSAAAADYARSWQQQLLDRIARAGAPDEAEPPEPTGDDRSAAEPAPEAEAAAEPRIGPADSGGLEAGAAAAPVTPDAVGEPQAGEEPGAAPKTQAGAARTLLEFLIGEPARERKERSR
jgi:phospholipid/cholesterol/gamma-HCH transport system substrate-binding protein